MGELQVVGQILSERNVLVVIAGLLALAIFRMWAGLPGVMAAFLERSKVRGAEKAADWSRLREEITRLEGRCERLDRAEEKCREDLASATKRIAQIEGFMLGQGDVRQAGAIASAEVRLDEQARRRRRKPGDQE